MALKLLQQKIDEEVAIAIAGCSEKEKVVEEEEDGIPQFSPASRSFCY
jgi:hypothetical protein